MSELQEAAGMSVRVVKLTPATLAPVLREGKEDEEFEGEDDCAQLAELPDGPAATTGVKTSQWVLRRWRR
jgi:hypothetical protein